MLIEQTVTDAADPNPLHTLKLNPEGLQNPPVDEKESCRECAWRYYCAGGCPALTLRAAGRSDLKSPNCTIYQALFPEVIRLEGLRVLRSERMA
jgi:uncharacterized protein